MNQHQLATAVWEQIKKLDSRDDHAIYERAEELDKEVKLHHIEAAFREIRFIDLEKQAMELAFESTEFQELASAFISKAARVIAKHERSLVIVNHREAA